MGIIWCICFRISRVHTRHCTGNFENSCEYFSPSGRIMMDFCGPSSQGMSSELHEVSEFPIFSRKRISITGIYRCCCGPTRQHQECCDPGRQAARIVTVMVTDESLPLSACRGCSFQQPCWSQSSICVSATAQQWHSAPALIVCGACLSAYLLRCCRRARVPVQRFTEASADLSLGRKIPAPMKVRLALPLHPPPPKKLKIPPSPQTRDFMGMAFLQKEPKIPVAQKIGAAISGPRIADEKVYGHEAFSDWDHARPVWNGKWPKKVGNGEEMENHGKQPRAGQGQKVWRNNGPKMTFEAVFHFFHFSHFSPFQAISLTIFRILLASTLSLCAPRLAMVHPSPC